MRSRKVLGVDTPPRLGWLIRPLGLFVVVMAALAGIVFGVRSEPLPLLGAVAIGLTGGMAVRSSIQGERRWAGRARAATAAAELAWHGALSAASQGRSSPIAADPTLPPDWEAFREQVVALTAGQIERLSREVRFAFKTGPIFSWRIGAAIPMAAARDDARRADAQRTHALAAARAAVRERGLIARFAAALGEVDQLVSMRLARPERAAGTASPAGVTESPDTSLGAIEWAALALFTAPSLTSPEYSALYGPWWRAVIVAVDPTWYAPWGRASLGGFWLVVVGLTMSPVAGSMGLAYAALGIVGLGVVGLATGALAGASHSRPWPEPPYGVDTPTASRAGAGDAVRRIWRWPERIIGRLARLFRSIGLA